MASNTLTRKASEEILRLIIQRLAVHPAVFSPHAYAVWYEYFIGTNAGLLNEMNKLLDNDQPVDDAAVERLYDTYASECNRRLNQILHDDMKNLLSRLIEVATETDKHTLTFGNSLQAYGQQLNAKPDLALLNELVSSMSSDTEFMHGSMLTLHTELEDSKEKVSVLQHELESARREALMDPLTGIYNRRGFEKQAAYILQQVEQDTSDTCLLMADIDHFKKINDTFGHLFGDKVLRTLAATLKSLLKGQDCVARLGGEEFAILLPNTSVQGARSVAENIRSTVEKGRIKHMNAEVHASGITVSIGIASYVRGASLAEWMDCADKALYVSKGSGRNLVTTYEAAQRG